MWQTSFVDHILRSLKERRSVKACPSYFQYYEVFDCKSEQSRVKEYNFVLIYTSIYVSRSPFFMLLCESIRFYCFSELLSREKVSLLFFYPHNRFFCPNLILTVWQFCLLPDISLDVNAVWKIWNALLCESLDFMNRYNQCKQESISPDYNVTLKLKEGSIKAISKERINVVLVFIGNL